LTRVLFFMHTASTIGGVETWLDRVCAHIATRGFDPVVGLVRGMKTNQPERYQKDHPDLATLVVDGRGMDREGRVRAAMRAIRKARPKIVMPLGIVDANEACVRAKQAGSDIRMIGRAQGNLPPMLLDLGIYREWMDHVVCPGKLTRRLLVEWAGYAPERVENISNGADLPVASRVRREPGQPIRLGYVGRLSPSDKRALDLIPLCEHLAAKGITFHLAVVGDGPCCAELERGLSKWSERVSLMGALAHDEVYRSVLPNLDVLVMPSATEAFGIVLVEALMHGVVPVSSRYHGFYSEGLVVDEVTGLSFEIGDMAAAADAVCRLDRDVALFEKLSAAAERHGAEYSWSRSMQKWEVRLDDLAKREPVLGSRLPELPRSSSQGRLEGLGVPRGMIDALRRLRRALLGPAVSAGGEEWPLFHRHHSRDALDATVRAIEALDRP